MGNGFAIGLGVDRRSAVLSQGFFKSVSVDADGVGSGVVLLTLVLLVLLALIVKAVVVERFYPEIVVLVKFAK